MVGERTLSHTTHTSDHTSERRAESLARELPDGWVYIHVE